MNKMLMVMLATSGIAWSACADDVAKWDPRMAESTAVVDTNGVKWIDGRYLPLEGRMFNDTEEYYDRLPANVTTNVNAGVRGMKHHTAGMQFRFETDSPVLWVKYESRSGGYSGSGNIAGVGRSGWDLYKQDAKGNWKFQQTSHNSSEIPGTRLRVKQIAWSKGNGAYLINLPLYDGVKSFAIGIAPKATVRPLAPRASGVNKPVVFYGTSITHGASASRPGLCFVNRVGRDLDVPVVNLGFSGSGVMEYEMSEHIARIDASCYVLDCLWNMCSDPKAKHIRSVERNYEPFIRNLRAKRPDVPIVMAEQCDVFCKGANPKDTFMKALYEKLVAEGWKNLVYLPKDKMYSGDLEGTIDCCHPNDLGMLTMTAAFGEAVREALKL